MANSNYLVKFPVVLEITMEVKAESEQEAIDAAIENFGFKKLEPKTYGLPKHIVNVEIAEWQAYEKIQSGNTSYSFINKATAEEQK